MRDKGATLIELLVVLTIFGIIGALGLFAIDPVIHDAKQLQHSQPTCNIHTGGN